MVEQTVVKRDKTFQSRIERRKRDKNQQWEMENLNEKNKSQKRSGKPFKPARNNSKDFLNIFLRHI